MRLQRVVFGIALISAGILTIGDFGLAAAQQRSQPQEQIQTRDQEQIYGSQLMTSEERAEYRARMRAATTDAQREQIRREHHQQMQVRAQQQGITLPEEPPAGGRGMGRGDAEGMGRGGGMGRDGGMGPGGGRR